MDQYLDNRQKEILWDLLANPADTGSSYTQSLERLVLDNPQSGILQVLLARAGNKQQLSKAAVYYNPRTLHKLINHPEDLAVVNNASILPLADNIYINHQNINNTQEEVIVADEPQTETVQDEYQAEAYEEITEAPIIEEADKEIAEPAEINNETDEVETEPVFEEPVSESYPNNEQAQIAEEPITQDEPEAEENLPPEPEYPHHDIEDEVYDEIVSIEDIGFEAIASEEYNAPAEPLTEARFSDPNFVLGPEEEEASFVLFHQPEAAPEPVQPAERSINEQEERLILGGIVNADYLRFDKKLDELRNATASADTSNLTEQPQIVTGPAAETQEVSRYDDDKMPYTFMWWLNKTRKEHAGTFQPYVDKADNFVGNEATVPSKMSTADELQQQYYENIFSLTSAGGVDRDADAKVEFDQSKKEDIIIERFIHTEPQIKPLSADKLDNENKAKKSSEDQDELVTETLARIYTDQMLYHKAIATYKKLILKFPEKKLYFAAQIEQLEKKTN